MIDPDRQPNHTHFVLVIVLLAAIFTGGFLAAYKYATMPDKEVQPCEEYIQHETN